MAMTVGVYLLQVDQREAILIMLIFTQYALQQVFHNKCLQQQTDIGRGVILTFSVLQDSSPAVRKWLSLFLMAK